MTYIKYSGDDRGKEEEEEEVFNSKVDDRFEFDPNECSVAHGRWVFNSSLRPLYSDRTCPYIDRQFSCVKNGRPDSDYRRWEWQPDDCFLPRSEHVHKYIYKYMIHVGKKKTSN